MSLVRNFNNVLLDEMFFYEYSKCQTRAMNFSSSNSPRRVFNNSTAKMMNVKPKMYIHYGESLKYLILKKIYFATINLAIKNDKITLDEFKKLSALIIEKEINANKKRLDKGFKHYDKIKKEIINKLPEHFDSIDIFDFENSIKNSMVLKIPLKQYLNKIKSKLRPFMIKTLPEFNETGEPYLKLEIMTVNKVSDFEVDVVVSFINEIDKEFIHRNFLVSILFNYFYYFLQEEFKIFFDVEKIKVRNLIIYNPLSMKRTIVNFIDIKGTLVEMDLFRILKVYIDNIQARTFDLSNCVFCENSIFCKNKTVSSHINAKENALFKDVKDIKEMI